MSADDATTKIRATTERPNDVATTNQAAPPAQSGLLSTLSLDGKPGPDRKSCKKSPRECPGGGILYLIQLNLPEKFLSEIKSRNPNLWRSLNATKIGRSEDWCHFLEKLQILQTYIPFATLRYVAIRHDLDAYKTEQAMHLVSRQWHRCGEWFDLNDENRNRILERFSACEQRRGTSHFPGQQVVRATECRGHFYVASFDWDEKAVNVINGIINNPAKDLEWRFICQQMLCSKIGSTIDLAGRGSEFIWANCFANMKYFAIQHETIRFEEQRLHDIPGAVRVNGSIYFIQRMRMKL